MKKKLISAVLSAALVLSSSGVFADGILNGAVSGENIIFNNVDADRLVISGYDNDGTLAYSSMFMPENGTVTVPKSAAEYSLKAYNNKTKEISDVIIEAEATAAPTTAPTATPAPTTAPTTAPTATPTPTSDPTNPNVFPPIYETSLNAIYAFSVVDSVSQEIQDGEEGYRLEYYYHGEKRSDWIKDDIDIASAPDIINGLIGGKLSALKRGDVIYINRGIFNKEIREISLIYQTQQSDIITSSTDFGANFQKLFSVQGTSVNAVGGHSAWTVQNYGSAIPSNGTKYAFGLVARRSGNVLYLMNKTGLVNNCIEVTMADDTIVYECDMNARSGIDTTRVTTIPSCISNQTWNKALDNPSTPLTFNADEGYSYALVRIVDGIAMDIILYSNY